MRWSTGWMLLLCAQALVASAAPQSAVLFPSKDYLPPAAVTREPFAEPRTLSKPPAPSALADTLAPHAAGSAADRCFSQCQAMDQRCHSQAHDETSCRSSLGVGRNGCEGQADPARRNTCLAQVQDCTTRGYTDVCASHLQSCVRACGN